ncbi:MAG: pseudouridine synthase [Chitinophagaceae bacterium]
MQHFSGKKKGQSKSSPSGRGKKFGATNKYSHPKSGTSRQDSSKSPSPRGKKALPAHGEGEGQLIPSRKDSRYPPSFKGKNREDQGNQSGDRVNQLAPHLKKREGRDQPFQPAGTRSTRPFQPKNDAGKRSYSSANSSRQRTPRLKKEEGDRSHFSGESNHSRPFQSKKDAGDQPYPSRKGFEKRSFPKKKEDGDRPFFPRESKDSRPFTQKREDSNSSYEFAKDRKKSHHSSPKQEGSHPFLGHGPSKNASSPFRNKGEKPFSKKESDPNRSRVVLPAEPKPGKRNGNVDLGENDLARRDEEEYLHSGGEPGFEKQRKKSSRLAKNQEGTENSGAHHQASSVSSSQRPKDQMPLNKYISHCGISSRRKAVDFIKAGQVTVNGKTVQEPGTPVTGEDQIFLDGKKLSLQKNLVYFLLNKPKGFLTTTDDPEGRKTVMELVRDATQERIFPVGRLDRNTSGLLLLTNDGDLAQKLAHPSHNMKKVYHVELDKPLTKGDFDRILQGVELEDGQALVDALAWVEPTDKKQIGIEIHSGKNRIVRRIFEHLEYQVEKLDRVMYAGLTKKNIPRGKWRPLTDKELILLKHFK